MQGMGRLWVVSYYRVWIMVAVVIATVVLVVVVVVVMGCR